MLLLFNCVGADKWERASSVKAGTHSSTISELKENQQYTFRVSARNQIGLSQSADLSGYILVKDQTVAPDANLGGLSQKIVEGRAGSKIIAEVNKVVHMETLHCIL